MRNTLPDTTQNQVNGTRVCIIGGVCAAAQIGTLLTINNVWYKNHPRSSFHLFNDNHQWLYMDKLGHATTAYQVGQASMNALKWAGVKKNQSVIYGSAFSFLYLTSIEILDGHSAEWGFSTGDVLANGLGSLLLATQELIWSEQRILLKFSTHLTPFAEMRPSVLGSSVSQRILKDYNGQTYWLSCGLSSFFKSSKNKIPNWLTLAIGYSGTGMLTGSNSSSELPNVSDARQAQWLLSLDIDLSKIRTKNKLLKTVFKTVNFVKIPMPTVELSNGSLSGHWFYF